jgi:hypothetical protein
MEALRVAEPSLERNLMEVLFIEVHMVVMECALIILAEKQENTI